MYSLRKKYSLFLDDVRQLEDKILQHGPITTARPHFHKHITKTCKNVNNEIEC